MRWRNIEKTAVKPVTFSKTKITPKMSSLSLFKIKNIIEISKIKNFKTKKIKERIKQHHRFRLSYSLVHLLLSHNNHPIRTQFKYKSPLINQIIDDSSFSSTFEHSAGGIPLVQTIISALQLQLSSFTSTNYFKIPLTIVLFLSMLITSHIANCQAIYNNNNYNNEEQRDKTYLFLSYYNNRSNNLSVNTNLNNKSLIEYSKSRLLNSDNNHNKKVTNYIESTTLDIIEYKPWPRKRKNHQNKSEYFNIAPKTNKSHRKYKTYHYEGNNDSQKDFGRNNFLLNMSLTNQTINSSLDYDNNEQLIKIVMDGLGLRTLPDYNKANISQLEYATKYNEYLERMRKRAIPDFDNISDHFDYNNDSNTLLSLLSIRHNSSEIKIYRQRRSPKRGKNKNKNTPTKSILLRFPLEISSDIRPSDIEEANIRLFLITSPALATSRQSKRRHSHNRQNRINKKNFGVDFNQNNNSNTTTTIKDNQKSSQKLESNSSNEPSHFLNLKVFQLLDHKGKVWIDGRKIEVKFDRNKMDESTSQWLQFDVTKAVEEWLVHKKKNLGLEIQCDNCLRNGARIIDDLSGDSEEDDDSGTFSKYDLAPVLNIIGRLGTHREKRSKHYHNQMTEKPKKKNHKSNCYKDNQRCCRHSMEVIFKEIKGFEFIIQPKVFDAGFCRGRCPPRYNPAHHHALLQSLIWKQDRKKVPRPCCAPSKLIELEVLHVDEKDNEKLKISTWTDMRVLECACS